MDLSSLQNYLSRLELNSIAQLSLVDASALSGNHMPSFPPSAPALIFGVNPENKAGVVRVLSAVYGLDLKIKLIFQSQQITETQLSSALNTPDIVALFVPAIGNYASFETFQEIIAHLRAPEDGCPWDKEQTHSSLRKHLIEESYEAVTAIDDNEPEKMNEEFGDLLLQIVLHAQIASEEKTFDMVSIMNGIGEKIVRRHPHVFGDTAVAGVDDVLSNWEKIKAKERSGKTKSANGMLDSIPPSLPALSQAQEYQDRAARVGFDWLEIEGVLEKIREEVEEVRSVTGQTELEEEIGDLLFSLVNLARWKKIDAESALRSANRKFKNRFSYIETKVNADGGSMKSMPISQLDVLWEEAKNAGL